MSTIPLKLERYRFGDPTPVDATKDIPTLTYVQDVSGRDDMKFSVLGSKEDSRNLFLPGDYAALKDTLGRALSWGRVLSRSTTIARQTTGELTAQPYPVTVSGWWDFFSRAQVHVLLGDVSGPYAEPIGTVFPVTAWTSFMAELTSSFSQALGQQLAFAFRRLGRVRVPETLGGGFLGDEIPVVYDEETARRFAPAFSGIEPVDSGYLLPDRLAGQLDARSTSVGAFLSGTFLPEPAIIELFPALVDGGDEPYSPLAAALGRRPVLVYRIKPWRDEPLWRNAVAKATYSPEDFEKSLTESGEDKEAARARENRRRAKDRNRQLLVKDSIFSKTTLDTGDITKVTPIPEKFIHTIKATADDSLRLNAATINVAPGGGEELDTLASADLPIIIDDQVEKHGLRMHQSRWPLVAPDGSADAAYYRTVASQVMQFGMMNHILETGTMDLHYTAAAVVQESTAEGQTTVRPALDIAHGRWFRTKVGDLPEYLGYVTAVQHAILRKIDGTLTAKTTIQFVRGHYADVGDLVRRAIVPVGRPVFTVADLARVPDIVGRMVSNFAPVVVPDAPPQARSKILGNVQRPAVTSGNFLLYRGAQLPTPFTVRHMPLDMTSAPTAYRTYRDAVPRTCILHTTDGGFSTDIAPVWAAFQRRVSAESSNPFVAHIVITPDGSIVQVADLGVTVYHTGGAAEFNETSVSVEFMVPRPMKNATRAQYEDALLRHPWPSQDEWRWLYTSKASGAGPYREGPVRPQAFGPTRAQKEAFKALASGFLTMFGFQFTSPPRPSGQLNRAVRFSGGKAVALAAYRNPAWAYFHHAQLEGNRSDAAGIDILDTLGVTQ